MAQITTEDLKQIVKDAAKEEIGSLSTSIKEETKAAIEEKFATLAKPADIKIADPTPDPKAGFKSFAEFAQQVAYSTVKGRITDQRLEKLITVDKVSSANESDAEYGGYLIPEEFRNELLQLAIEKSNVLGMARTIPMSSTTVSIPYIKDPDHSSGAIHGGVKFSWLDEEALKSETRPTFGRVTLRLKKCAGLCYVSDELLQDSPISMEPLLTGMFGDAFAWTLDNVFINGNGAGQPLGILKAPALVTVDKEAGQVADTMMFENIINMYSRIYSKANCVWMANDDVFPQLAAMSMSVGTGGAPVWLPAGGISGKPYDTLMGKPIIWTEHCQTIGDKGDIYLVDWSQYLVGQKSGPAGGLQFASSIHLKFDYDQTAFRFVFRIDGQPWWASAITPRYSAKTKSPFVTLAARA